MPRKVDRTRYKLDALDSRTLLELREATALRNTEHQQEQEAVQICREKVQKGEATMAEFGLVLCREFKVDPTKGALLVGEDGKPVLEEILGENKQRYHDLDPRHERAIKRVHQDLVQARHSLTAAEKHLGSRAKEAEVTADDFKTYLWRCARKHDPQVPGSAELRFIVDGQGRGILEVALSTEV